MPSPESQRLELLYASMAEQLAAQSSLETTRAIFELNLFAGREPTDVTYEEVDNVGGVHGVWAHPAIAHRDRAILYFHGGCFMAGSATSHRKLCGHLGKATRANVLALDYRRSPEHAFPSQLEDAVAAYKWLLNTGFRPGNVALAGDSAGGNLASAVCLKLVADGITSNTALPCATVAFSPWVDMEITGATFDINAPNDKLVNKGPLVSMRDAFLQGAEQTNPLANLLYAEQEHLKKLPPSYISVGTFEVLLDDSERWANKLKEAGVDVTYEKCDGMQHVHVLMAGHSKEADDTLDNVGSWLETKFSQGLRNM